MRYHKIYKPQAAIIILTLHENDKSKVKSALDIIQSFSGLIIDKH